MFRPDATCACPAKAAPTLPPHASPTSTPGDSGQTLSLCLKSCLIADNTAAPGVTGRHRVDGPTCAFVANATVERRDDNVPQVMIVTLCRARKCF